MDTMFQRIESIYNFGMKSIGDKERRMIEDGIWEPFIMVDCPPDMRAGAVVLLLNRMPLKEEFNQTEFFIPIKNGTAHVPAILRTLVTINEIKISFYLRVKRPANGVSEEDKENSDKMDCVTYNDTFNVIIYTDEVK